MNKVPVLMDTLVTAIPLRVVATPWLLLLIPVVVVVVVLARLAGGRAAEPVVAEVVAGACDSPDTSCASPALRV